MRALGLSHYSELESLKFFFQLDHLVEISLYLTDATGLRQSRELVGLTQS